MTQGYVKGRSYRVKKSAKYLRADEVEDVEGGVAVEKSSGLPVVVEWEKMSKSKYNGVDPGVLVDKYGCDTVRMMMLTDVGPSHDRNWSEDTFPGVRNLQVMLTE